jgi:hypothetical protein
MEHFATEWKADDTTIGPTLDRRGAMLLPLLY